MWGYKINGVIIATNPNNMSGNTGWEEVPDDAIIIQQEFPSIDTPLSTDEKIELLADEIAGLHGFI